MRISSHFSKALIIEKWELIRIYLKIISQRSQQL